MKTILQKTKSVKIGQRIIGGGSPVLVQSMTNTDTRKVDETVAQIKALTAVGCDIVRVSVYDEACAKAIKEIKARIDIPLVADVHFDYRLAIAAIQNGADKLRINPGNIGSAERVKMVVDCAKDFCVPIRIGVNAGSLEKEWIEKFHGVTPEGMVQSALKHVKLLEDQGFDNIVISLKASDVKQTVQSYRLMAQSVPYPLHLGVTEAGIPPMGIVKSSVGIGALLLDGIGDTLRVSLTGDPLQEIIVGRDILKSVGLLNEGLEIIACPTCGRCQLDIEGIVREIERRIGNVKKPLKVAVMGCAVNGPGEAKSADIGMAGGVNSGVLFKHGEILKSVKTEHLVDVLVQEIKNLLQE